MPIVVFSEVILKNAVLAAGVRGRNSGMNRRIEQVSGYQAINIMREQALRQYDWSTVPLRRADWQYMETLHEVTNYGANGFLLEDPKDSVVATGVVAALTSTTFQLYKRYTHEGTIRTKDRKITRPRASSFVLTVSGVVQTSGYSLNVETGVLTINSGPAASAVSWTGRFYVPVHFQSDTIDWTMVVAGQDPDARYMAGPSVILQEVRE